MRFFFNWAFFGSICVVLSFLGFKLNPDFFPHSFFTLILFIFIVLAPWSCYDLFKYINEVEK